MPVVTRVMGRERMIVSLATAVHRLYKVTLSPLFGDACRFTPYCSDYALEAITVHGFFYGSWLALKRVCRCHALNPGGHDPVPPSRLETQSGTRTEKSY